MPPIPRSAARAVGFALALSLLAAVPARAQVQLRWKFQPDETLSYQMQQKMLSKASFGGRDLQTVMNQTVDTTWKVQAVSGGTATLLQTIDRIRCTMEVPNIKYEYDSQAKAKPEGPLANMINPIFDALVGSSFSFKMNARGEVSDVKVPEKLVNALKANPQMAQAGPMFTEEGLKNMITQSTLTLPDGSIARGKSWTKKVEIPNPQMGAMVLDNTYTYDGPQAQGGSAEKIEVKTTIDIQHKDGAQNQVIPQIKSQDARGTYLFDNDKGRLSESNITQKMEMSVKPPGGNQEVNQTVETTAIMKLARGGSGR